jgi:hypothetical protein
MVMETKPMRFIWPCSDAWLAVKMKRNGRPRKLWREARKRQQGSDKIRTKARIEGCKDEASRHYGFKIPRIDRMVVGAFCIENYLVQDLSRIESKQIVST